MLNTSLFPYQPAPNASADEAVGITEIVLPHCKGLSLLMPTLAHLSRLTGKRWFTWMPHQRVTKESLRSYEFDLTKIRLIHPSCESQTFGFLWEALAQGNSQTVVASPGRLTEKQIGQLEQAAQIGQCTGLLVRYR